MEKCRTCRHWKLNDHGLAFISATLENRNYPIENEDQLKKMVGFDIRECTHPKVITSRSKVLEKDSVLLSYDDYQSHPGFFCGPDYGCNHHEKHPVTL